jgi:response regulator RpfG family c-di-GMP phosphodiesterase
MNATIDETMRHIAEVFEKISLFVQDGEALLSSLRTEITTKHRQEPFDGVHRLTAVAEQAAAPLPNEERPKPTLLFVDDSEPLLRALSRVLREKFAITTASTVDEALAVIESQSFDAILCDLHLPDGEGLRVLNAFAYASPNGARLLYTAASIATERIRSALLGGLIHRTISKPVTPDIIEEAVREELQKLQVL